ncbi:MAG TPA: acetoin utilization protein AcuC [Nitriliruptorales bacterium]|nr:acetoin utilization protein AcuC [Nitriliruptorales bacterium]
MAGEGPEAAGRVALVWDGPIEYDFGPQHPLQPVRVELTVELIRALGICDGERAEEVPSSEFGEDELLRVHERDYVEAVQRISASNSSSAWEYGLGPGDNPTFPGMHEASMQVCAASKQAARLVWEGEADHAFNPAGGLHHAMPRRASGFCIYNDPAVAIDWLLHNGAERIAYLDVDVHHGDGVERMFWDDPRVVTISLHESGRYLFPGTGFPSDIGGDGAEGSAANLTFDPRTTGDVWLSAFDEVVPPLVDAFRPDVLVTQLGCDTHVRDPLAHLALTVDDYAEIARRVHRLAHEAAGGRWVALGGGGYKLVEVVPRAWSIWFAELAGAELPEETPESWRELARERVGESPPRTFSDGDAGVPSGTRSQTSRAAEEAVEHLKQHVLARHGARGGSG